MTDKLAKAGFAALVPTDGMSVAELIKTNTGGAGMSEGDITRLSIPAGGGLAWEIPSIDGEDVVKDLECVVLGFNDHRVYYEGEYTGDKKPPRCSSRNLHTGQWVENYDDDIDEWATQDRSCATCPMNQWGSKGRGKACSERRLVLILTQDKALPFLVDISPGSLTTVRKYFNMLTSERKPYFACVTKLGLKKVESGGGIVYSQVHPSFVRDLTEEELVGATQMREAVSSIVAEAKPVEGAPF